MPNRWREWVGVGGVQIILNDYWKFDLISVSFLVVANYALLFSVFNNVIWREYRYTAKIGVLVMVPTETAYFRTSRSSVRE